MRHGVLHACVGSEHCRVEVGSRIRMHKVRAYAHVFTNTIVITHAGLTPGSGSVRRYSHHPTDLRMHECIEFMKVVVRHLLNSTLRRDSVGVVVISEYAAYLQAHPEHTAPACYCFVVSSEQPYRVILEAPRSLVRLGDTSALSLPFHVSLAPGTPPLAPRQRPVPAPPLVVPQPTFAPLQTRRCCVCSRLARRACITCRQVHIAVYS